MSPDREDTVLIAAAAILGAGTPAEAVETLASSLTSLFELSWLAVADTDLRRFSQVQGTDAPSVKWVSAFAEGSRSGDDPANDTTSSGVFVEPVPGTGCTVCGGRPVPIRRRERHEIGLLVTGRVAPGLGAGRRVRPATTRSLAAMVRIGFVGAGLIAWAHGLGLKAMIDAGVIDASVEAVYDQRERRARSFAEAMGAEVAGDAAAVAASCDFRLGMHADCGAPSTPSTGPRGRWTRRVLREAARRRPARCGGPRRGGRCRRGAEPVWTGAAQRTGLPGASRARRFWRAGNADGRRVPRRPVLPHSGHLPLEVAGRRHPGRGRLPH